MEEQEKNETKEEIVDVKKEVHKAQPAPEEKRVILTTNGIDVDVRVQNVNMLELEAMLGRVINKLKGDSK